MCLWRVIKQQVHITISVTRSCKVAASYWLRARFSEVRRNCYKDGDHRCLPGARFGTTLHTAVESSFHTNMAAENALTELLLMEVSTFLVSTIFIVLYMLILRGEPRPYSYWPTRKLDSSTFAYRRGHS